MNRAPECVTRWLPGAMPVVDLGIWSRWVLGRAGFDRSTALAVTATCRDELMMPTEQVIAGAWGEPFIAGSLAGMLFLGRTGMAAALDHAPAEDGRLRLVFFCLPHIGIDADGDLGPVERPGLNHATSACGALMAVAEQPQLAEQIDLLDIEKCLLARRLVTTLHVGGSLLDLTRAARQAIVADARALAAEARGSRDLDVAYVSGIVVHGPDGVEVVGDVEITAEVGGEEISFPSTEPGRF